MTPLRGRANNFCSYKLGRNRHPLAYALLGVAVFIGVVVWLRPGLDAAATSATYSIACSQVNTMAKATFGYESVQPVLAPRCYLCHGAQLQMKNVRLDSPELVRQHAAAIYQLVVVTQSMPMNNATGITEAERALIRQWFEAGAKTP